MVQRLVVLADSPASTLASRILTELADYQTASPEAPDRDGIAVWDFSTASVRYVFADSTGDDIADRLLDALRKAGGDGLDGTQQNALFSGHVPARRLSAARAGLLDRGLAVNVRQPTEGRPRFILFHCGRSRESKRRAPRAG